MSNIIVMAFSPLNIVGCLLKKAYKGGGVTGTPGPPSLRPCNGWFFTYLVAIVEWNTNAKLVDSKLEEE